MENIISKTLLLPLYFRAMDAKKEDSVLNDKWALELIKNFQYDDKKMQKAKFSAAGTIARAKFLDDGVREFIRKHPKPVVVNFACGLDARSLRVWDEKAVFYDIDLPEVVNLRKQYIQDKSILCAYDAFGDEFNKELLKHQDAQFCFVYEGFLMYFDKLMLTGLIKNLTSHFTGEIMGDFNFGNYWELNQKKHDIMDKNEASFKTSFENVQELLSLSPKLKLEEERMYHDKSFAHILGWRRHLMRLAPKKMTEAMRMLRLSF